MGSPLEGFFTAFQLLDRNAWLTMGGLRFYLAHRRVNGLDETGAVIKIGRKKILIHEQKFIDWLLAGGRVTTTRPKNRKRKLDTLETQPL